MAGPLYPVDPESDDYAPDWGRAAGPAQTRETAEYLGDMIGQLESLSRLAGLDLLTYLLAMARAEAESNARGAERR